MKKVSFTLDTLPPLTEDQRDKLVRLAAMPEDEIDTSEAPELSGAQWSRSVRGSFYRPLKRQITTRIDEDILHWLQASGRGYQSRLNAILREKMLASGKRRTRPRHRSQAHTTKPQ